MHDDSALVRNRVRRFVSERLRPLLHRASVPLTVTAWEVPGEPVPFARAVSEAFTPFATGTAWGRPWGTVWFHVTGTVPAAWATESGATAEVLIDLGFTGGMPGFQAEGLVWSPAGTVVKGIEPRNNHVPAPGPGEAVDFFVEAAANPDVGGGWSFAPTPLGDVLTAGEAPLYALRRMDLVLRDDEVTALLREVDTLSAMLDHATPATGARGAEILRALERMVDAMDPVEPRATVPAGRAALRDVLARPAHASAHRVTAVGHAHIDSAWLWPTRETRRKVARTFANVLSLMESEPDFVFAASSAQQYAWLKEDYPELFERVRARVAEGRFVPVGGMWVESDTNLPGGEALARQLIAGTSFFLREFGVPTHEVWLPDSFGYTGALPQLAAGVGARFLLTQKISWNETNTFPHHTFWWEGIDGTRLFAHFPPVNTYNSELNVPDLVRAERTYAEKGRARSSLVPFGFGDGGGGPSRELVEAGRLAADLEGLPTVHMGAPLEFFLAAQAEYPDPPVWTGELYLEFHRGTYTSQARVKRGNRRSEHLLREAELWATTAAVRAGAAYPYEELERCWHTVLLNQFHDILPGTSIAWVYRVAHEDYARVERDLEAVIATSLAALGAGGDALVANAGPFARAGVPALAVGAPAVATPGTVTREGEHLVLRNGSAEITIDHSGRVSSAVHLASGRETVPPGQHLAQLELFHDTPNAWDAWDIDVHYRRGRTVLDAPSTVEIDGDAVVVVHHTGDSRVQLRLSLVDDAPTLSIETRVEWHERQRLLKLAFPVDVHTDRAAAEIQFGHLYRPITENTSWDVARFETSAHRWVHVGEAGFGVAVANDASYGHDITRLPRAGGGTFALVRQSLLRAPLFPDPEADQGSHLFTSTVTLGATVADAVREGYRVNLPARPAGGAVEPLLTVDNPAVVVEAVKLADDRSGDIVVRLYESLGGRASAVVSLGFPAAEVAETDLLERPLPAPVAWSADESRLTLRPFQIVTLRVRR